MTDLEQFQIDILHLCKRAREREREGKEREKKKREKREKKKEKRGDKIKNRHKEKLERERHGEITDISVCLVLLYDRFILCGVLVNRVLEAILLEL